MVLGYVLMRIQGHLPLNPVGLGAVNQYVSFNTATSFITNTNWQAYGGETTMSYLTQMLVMTFQNFVSAAVGMAVLIALIRGFVRSRTQELGNFWQDLVRTTVYILIPFSVVLAILLVTQGVVQTFSNSAVVHGIQGFGQTIARGPVASPDRDEAAGDERRRVLQRELGPPVRRRERRSATSSSCSRSS